MNNERRQRQQVGPFVRELLGKREKENPGNVTCVKLFRPLFFVCESKFFQWIISISVVSHRLAVCLRHTGLYPGVDPQLVGAIPLGVKKNGLKLHTHLVSKQKIVYFLMQSTW